MSVMTQGPPPSLAVGLFGRRAVSDPRDLWYLLADRELEAFDADPGSGSDGSVRYARGPIYNQSGQPTDVSCALLAALHASPGRIGPSRCPSVAWLDQQARAIEGVPAAPVSSGLTLRSGCRALRSLGLIVGYAWTYDVSEVIRWLWSGRGGLVLGLDWYARMSHPDPSGLIRAHGRPLGGHAVFAWGIDAPSSTVLLQNSWGEAWGGWSTRPGRRDFAGCARLPLSDLKKLLSDNGEAVALVKNPSWDHRAGLAR